MKRSPMPARTTSLRGSPEAQRAWQDRTRTKALTKARETPHAASKTGALTRRAGEHRARRLVHARSGDLCEAGQPGCTTCAQHWHHRRNRSQGGTWAASNGLHVCPACHWAVTDTAGNRATYEACGWVVPSHTNPATTPVQHARLGWVLLGNEGGWTPAPEPHAEPETAA